MNAVYLIVIYGVVCLSIIIFNMLLIVLSKVNTKLNATAIKKEKVKIKQQFKRIEDNLGVDESHIKYLKKRLRKRSKLMVFDEIVTSYQHRNNPYIVRYLLSIKDVFTELMHYYVKKNDTIRAYYLGIVKDYNILYQNTNPSIDTILFESLQDKNFYCRGNAYLAICKMGEANKVIRSLLNISTSSKFFHENIIMTGLNIYNGDADELINLSMGKFNSFSDEVKCCIIKYISYYNKDNCSQFVLSLITKKQEVKKVIISCLNYFEYVHYDKAEEVLIDLANQNLNKDFFISYATIRALRNYSSKNSIRAINKAVYSDSFKIRDIACESLAVIRLGLRTSDINEMLAKDEIYDMYNYYIKKNIEKKVK